MKKLIASMIVSVIMGQPILAGQLSMAQWRLTDDPKLDASNLLPLNNVYVPAIQKNRTRVWVIQKNRTRVWMMLGGAAVFGLLSWLQFDRASANEAEAVLNREHGQLSRAQKLDDKADRARLYGWSTAVLAAGSLGVALISRKTTHPVFPELSFRDGEPHLSVSYVYSFGEPNAP